MDINQSSSTAIVNYQTFNIGSENTVNINMPNSTSSFLGRVVGNNMSTILGNLNSNGSVYLVNQQGFYFGESAQINVNHLVASTLNLSNSDFLNSPKDFQVTGEGGEITNAGTITAQTVALLAEKVENQGQINAQSVGIGAGQSAHVLIDEVAGGRIVMDFSDAEIPTGLIRNNGEIQALSANDQVASITITSNGEVSGSGSYNSENNIDISAAGSFVNEGSINSGIGNVSIQSHSEIEVGTITSSGGYLHRGKGCFFSRGSNSWWSY